MNEEFNLNQILEILLPKWPFILISTLLMGMIFFLYSTYLIDPTYTASGTLYITGDVDAIYEEDRNDTNLNDLMISQELAKTYGQILSSNTFFKKVAKASETGYTFSQLQGMTNISNIVGTGLLKISVNHNEPEMAAHISNTILNQAPDEIARVIVAGSATVIDPAEVPKSPSAPSIPKNVAVGALVGFAFAIIVVFLRSLLDKTIKSAEELKMLFGIPVLGTIPLIEKKKETTPTTTE